MGVRLRLTRVVALALILTAIVLPASYARWLDTRSFVAFEMPVSLAPDKLASETFQVNLEGWYSIRTDVDQSFQYRFDCGFGGLPPLLKTRVSIYRDGQVLEQADGADRFLGQFHAEPGKHYEFELEVLTDASCLNSGHPRIFVWTNQRYYDYLQDVLWVVSAVLLLWGLGVLLFSIAGHTLGRVETQTRLSTSEGVGPYYPSHRTKPLRLRFAHFPSYSLLYALLLSGVLLPCFLIVVYDNHSVGIKVHLVREPPLATTLAPSPLVLRLESRGQLNPPQLYLRSESLEWEGLGAALREELKSRADWVVYVESDSDTAWTDVANAMDIIRADGARVVLLTTEAPTRIEHPQHRKR